MSIYHYSNNALIKLNVTFVIVFFSLFVVHQVAFGQNPKAATFTGHTNHYLVQLLQNDTSAIIRKVMANPRKYHIQIIYTRITRDKKYAYPTLQKYYFRVNPEEYFYPASLVKLPLALLTLEKLHTINKKGVHIFAQYKTHGDFAPPAFYISADGTKHYHSLAYHLNKSLVISDNLAPNYMYEMLGKEYIDKRLKKAGFSHLTISNRFSNNSPNTNSYTGPVAFVDSLNNTIWQQDSIRFKGIISQPIHRALVGKGYIHNNYLVRKPRDFKLDNYASLEDLDEMLTGVMFPELNRKLSSLNLEPQDYEFLQYLMGLRPRKSTYPVYSPDSLYPDNMRKFILKGTQKGPIEDNITIINKVGMAYGFLSDIAYIHDNNTNVEFMVSAVIYANRDEILNDGSYDYESIGLPFLTELGRLLYQHELKSK